MTQGWTIKDFLVFILFPIVLLAGGGLFIAWMSPSGVSGRVVSQLSVYAIGAVVVGWAVRRHRGRTRSLDDFLASVPRWGWALFVGAHGAVLGLLLGLAWQVSLMPLMLGLFAAAAVAGAILPVHRHR